MVGAGPRSLSSTSPLQSPALGVLTRYLPQKTSPPPGQERSHAFLAHGGLGTGHASLEASPRSSCGYWGTGIWHVLHCWLPGLTFPYPVQEGGLPLTLFGVPL